MGGESSLTAHKAGLGRTAPGLGGGNSSAPAQFDDHLLAVVAGAPVPHFLQRAGCFRQQDCALARGREEGEGEVAAGQENRRGSLSLSWQRVQLTLFAALGGASPQAVLQQLVSAGGAGACHQAHSSLVQEHLAISGPEAMGQFAQAAEVSLETRQLRGRGVVGLTQGLAGVCLLLPQRGAE